MSHLCDITVASLAVRRDNIYWQVNANTLGPAKTYILRGTPRTCAFKTRAATDN